jgi:molecular chaperone GrpE
MNDTDGSAEQGDGAAPEEGSGPPDDGAADTPEATAPDASEAGAAPDARYLRLAADFDNFRRRTNRELADRARFASEDAARAMLPVLDNLRRAVEHSAEAAGDDLMSGLELVVREFETALAKLGVTTIDAVGQPFDPAVHEAIGGDESGEVDVDTVATELQRGYRLHDRVLRPALVRVAHPAGTAGPD